MCFASRMPIPSAVVSVTVNTNESSKSDEDDSVSSSSSSYSSSVSSSVFTSSLSSFEYGRTNNLPNSDDDESSSSESDESSNDDAIANMIGPLMQQRGNAIGEALAERCFLSSSIKWLGHHLPDSVVAFLIDQIEDEIQSEQCESSKQSSSLPKTNHDHDENDIDNDNDNDDDADNDADDETDSQQERSLQFPQHLTLTRQLSSSSSIQIQHLQQQRRYSSFAGMESTTTIQQQSPSEQPPSEEQYSHRRSSMPLVVRNLEGKPKRRASIRRSSSKESFASESSIRFHRQSCSRQQSQRRGSAASSISIQHQQPLSESQSQLKFERRQLGLDIDAMSSDDNNSTAPQQQPYFDPFPYDSDDEKHRQEQLRQHRVMKTRDSIVRLTLPDNILGMDDSSRSNNNSRDSFYFNDSIPSATRHDCALLFVDISGFTKLSTTLNVEPLSKVRSLSIKADTDI